jgi:hypothetical protein
MRWCPVTPRKANLVLRFKAAKRRMTTQTDNVAELANTRIATATVELNQIVDDIRDAQDAPEKPPRAVQKEPPLVISTVGKILRRSKIDR